MPTQAIRRHGVIELDIPGAIKDQNWQHDVHSCELSTTCEDPGLYQASIIDRLESPVQFSALRRIVSYRISDNIQHSYRQSEDIPPEVLLLVPSIYSHDT
jgi:hypothetical protein